MWTPDVYEGAPTPVTTFFASAPKMAAMAILVRVAFTAFPGITGDWRQIVTFISIASMALGSFAAIGQTNIKRLMAYSSIGHMGFALVGLAAGTVEGAQGVILYMSIYLVMTLGTFAAILSMRRDGKAVETITDLAGLARTNAPMAFFLGAMMFSLAGIPPLAGFFAKFYVFAAAIKADLYGWPSSACSPARSAPITICASSSSCISTSRPRRSIARESSRASCWRSRRSLIIVFAFAPAPLTNAAMAAAQVAVLNAGGRPLQRALSGWRVAHFDSLDSTNEEARRRALGGDPGRLWVVAEEQSAGRGRQGRRLGLAPGQSLRQRLADRPLSAVDRGAARLCRRRRARSRGRRPRRRSASAEMAERSRSGDGAKCAGLLVEGVSLAPKRLACVVGDRRQLPQRAGERSAIRPPK